MSECPPIAEPAFCTERLRVWMVRGAPQSDADPRLMFIACESCGDWPGVAVSCSVWDAFEHTVDWIQTSDECRGAGLGAELIRGIERHLGATLRVEPVSESGERMTTRLEAGCSS